MIKTVALVRGGRAFGDTIWVTPAPRLLAEQGNLVSLFIQRRMFPLFANNPHVHRLIEYPSQLDFPVWEDTLKKEVEAYDQWFNASGFVDMNIYHRSDAKWGPIPPLQTRRDYALNRPLQGQVLKGLGLDPTAGPEFYLSPAEVKRVEAIRTVNQRKKRKLVIWHLEGSSRHKELWDGPQWIRQVEATYPRAHHKVVCRNPQIRAALPQNGKVSLFWADNLRDLLVELAAADLVVGAESFLINAAVAFSCAKILICSHSAPSSYLTPAWGRTRAFTPSCDCAPCYKIQIEFRAIYHPERRALARMSERACQIWENGETQGYHCARTLPHQEIVQAAVNFLREQ